MLEFKGWLIEAGQEKTRIAAVQFTKVAQKKPLKNENGFAKNLLNY